MYILPASKSVTIFFWSAKISMGKKTFGIYIWFLSTKDRMNYCKSIKQATTVISGSYNNKLPSIETNGLY